MIVNDEVYRTIGKMAYSNGIGNTPIREIYCRGDVRVVAKFESYNKFGSVKDRPAFFMLSVAMKEGKMAGGKEVIEASSGNTGIALAYISRILGLKATILVPASSSVETKKVLKDSHQNIIEVEDQNSRMGKINIDGALKRLEELMRDDPERYVNLDQYSNPSNFRSHYHTTGPEISSKEKVIDHLVTGIGTGGTIMGLGMYLKEINWKTKVTAAEPGPNHHIQGLKNLKASRVPRIIESNRNLIDDWVSVSDKIAFDGVRELKELGYEVGLSSGANYMASMKVARRLKAGTVLTIFPDGPEKYRSIYQKHGI